MVSDVRKELVHRIKRRLAAPRLTIIDARDSIRDCFVATYLGGIAAGVEGLDLQATPSELERITERIFRARLLMQGASWEAPTVDALERVKKEADGEFHFDRLPVEASAMHDQVCSLLLGKVDGLVPHVGDKSAVTKPVRQATAVQLSMRKTISAFLTQFGSEVESGLEVDALSLRVEKLQRLINVLADLE